METRKLIKFGNSSHVLSLPYKWLKEHNLNKGDSVYISTNGNGELIVAPEHKEIKKELKVKNICIDGKDKDRVQREVIAAYLNDINIIKLNGKEVETRIGEIRSIVHDLIALEILEQNKNHVVARDFLNLESISIKKLIHKMDMITRSMFSDISLSVTKEQGFNIMDRDKELNRIFFLAVRSLKVSFNNPILNQKVSYNELLYYWYVIHKIESIADKLKGLSWFLINLKINAKIQEKLFSLYKEIEKHYLDVMKVFYLGDIESAYKLSCIKHELQEECDKFLQRKNLDKISIRIMDKLKTIIIEIHNIIREVYNNYPIDDKDVTQK